jgi:uncharacterized phage protein gp47/JayE
MSYPIPSFDAIRNRYLTTLQNMNPDFDISVDSDHYVRATALASVVEGLYQLILWGFRQIFPDTADASNVMHHAAVKGLVPKEATHATGTALISGQAGAVLPIGAQMVLNDGRMVTLIGNSVTLTGAPQTIAVRAVNSGAAGNVTDARGTHTLSHSGVASEATQINLADGVDAESMESLLARLLDLLRNPPAGGKVTDLKRWAEAVAGVEHAYVYPRLRGLGTSDVFISTPTGLPSEALIARTLNELVTKSPAGIKNIAVRAPSYKLVNVTVRVVGSADFETVLKPMVQALITGYFATLGPGDGLMLSKLRPLIESHSQISDCVFDAPITNILASVNGATLDWIQLGVLTVSPLV